jgi:hypothetical protein
MPPHVGLLSGRVDGCLTTPSRFSLTGVRGT